MNNHITELNKEITDLHVKIKTKRQMMEFISTHSNIFTNDIILGLYGYEIAIYTPLDCLEEIVKTWGQSDWVRIPSGKESINWERKIGDFTITLHGMEKCAPVLVPLNAWPIMLEEGN
jgi:hypothetical protein